MRENFQLTYPTSIMTIGPKKNWHQHNIAWLNAIHTRTKGRRLFIKLLLPRETIVVWLNAAVVKEMVKFLERDKPLRGLSPHEKRTLNAPPRKKHDA